MGFYQLPIDTYRLSLTVFELLSWLLKRFRPSVRQFLSKSDNLVNKMRMSFALNIRTLYVPHSQIRMFAFY